MKSEGKANFDLYEVIIIFIVEDHLPSDSAYTQLKKINKATLLRGRCVCTDKRKL